jgi:hypothetical protein
LGEAHVGWAAKGRGLREGVDNIGHGEGDVVEVAAAFEFVRSGGYRQAEDVAKAHREILCAFRAVWDFTVVAGE